MRPSPRGLGDSLPGNLLRSHSKSISSPFQSISATAKPISGRRKSVHSEDKRNSRRSAGFQNGSARILPGSGRIFSGSNSLDEPSAAIRSGFTVNWSGGDSHRGRGTGEERHRDRAWDDKNCRWGGAADFSLGALASPPAGQGKRSRRGRQRSQGDTLGDGGMRRLVVSACSQASPESRPRPASPEA